MRHRERDRRERAGRRVLLLLKSADPKLALVLALHAGATGSDGVAADRLANLPGPALTTAEVEAESRTLDEAIKTGNLEKIIARYPIRETAALTRIANKLGFQDRNQYEGAVRKLIMDDNEALKFVRNLFGRLASDIAAV